MKVGVGVLRKKDDAPYSAYGNYDIVSTGQWEVEESPGRIDFVQTVSDPLSGYGYEYRKTLRVTKGRPELAIEHSLREHRLEADRDHAVQPQFSDAGSRHDRP